MGYCLLALIVLASSFYGAFSAAVPEQIALNYGANPSEMVVTWAIVENNVSSQEVHWGSSPENLNNVESATAIKYSMGSYTSPSLYKAIISNLTANNQVYYYRVGGSMSTFSDTFSFKSHPGVGVANVNFHIIGDLGQTSNSINTLQEVYDDDQKTEAISGGIVNMGDLSYANGDQPYWDSFGKMKQFVNAYIPMLTTSGNHEWFDSSDYSFLAYKSRFDYPLVNGKKELYYSFEVGLVHWVMVAGYCQEMKSVLTQPCLSPGSVELQWLQNDLASVDRTNTPWVVVVFHQPYVNSNTAHSMSTEGSPMEAAIEDTLYNAKVDLVFSGHVHAYERSCQVYKYVCTAGAPYYITIGDGGNAEGLASTWKNPQPSWSMFRQASYGHGELTAVNATHLLWQWRQNGDLTPTNIDSFWILKDSNNEQSDRSNDVGSKVGITLEPLFAETERGRVGFDFNNMVSQRRSHNGTVL